LSSLFRRMLRTDPASDGPGNPPEKITVAATGEMAAEKFLRKKGYRIVTRNFRARNHGEIDIIAVDGDTLCFVEVKARVSEAFGGPEAAVTKKKQLRIVRAAQYYISRKKLHEVPCRFDVVSVRLGQDAPQVEVIRDAFQAR
jgi:putative endonuclease